MTTSIQSLIRLAPPAKSLACPLCGAKPTESCTITRGKWKGYEATNSHKQRALSSR